MNKNKIRGICAIIHICDAYISIKTILHTFGDFNSQLHNLNNMDEYRWMRMYVFICIMFETRETRSQLLCTNKQT